MFKREITNKMKYNGEREAFEDDTYSQEHTRKLSLFGIVFYKRTFKEDVIRENKSDKKKVGF